MSSSHHCPWDYHHITPVYPITSTPSPHKGLIKFLSVAIFVLGISILGITAVRWWRQNYQLYTYQGSDNRLLGTWVASANKRNGHPVFIRTNEAGVNTYLYHGSVPADRSLWIFSMSLNEEDDTQHIAYASGSSDSLQNLVVTGNSHVGRMQPV